MLVLNTRLPPDFVHPSVLGFLGEAKDSDELNRYVSTDLGTESDSDNTVVYTLFSRSNVFNGLGTKCSLLDMVEAWCDARIYAAIPSTRSSRLILVYDP